MNVDLFGNQVRCETDGFYVSLNDMEKAGNQWRLSHGMAAYQLGAFIRSQTLQEYIDAAAVVWDRPIDSFIKRVGKGKNSRTMGHVSIAVLLAEQMSPMFHALVHKVFIEGKILEFREHGGTEFKNLNAAIDLYLPDRQNQDNTGIYIQTATRLRSRILGTEEPDWGQASVGQTHRRYESEKTLCTLLKLGVVKDWAHLKELIDRI